MNKIANVKPIQIVYRERDSVRVDPKNPRVHSRQQIKKLADSIRTFGFNAPILINKDLVVIAGHARLEASKLLGLDQVPTICLEHLNQKQQQAYLIADNRLSEMAVWDDALLAETLKSLAEVELDFDIEATGFELGEIEVRILGDASAEPEPELQEREIAGSSTPISKPGDLWELGQHRLYCGDALDPASYDRILEGKRADVIFTDPPYNVAIRGHASGKGKVVHSDFEMASGEMTSEEFVAFLTQGIDHIMARAKPGAIGFICMDWRHVGELLRAGEASELELKNICVWVKANVGMGSFYRSQHELVFVYKKRGALHRNNVQLGRFGRDRSNVWNYPGATTPGSEDRSLLSQHPTVKPVNMIADAIKDCSARNSLILDPFAGSGSTIIAAQRTGRKAAAIELEPRFVDVAIRRWQNLTRDVAVHAVTRKSFDNRESQ